MTAARSKLPLALADDAIRSLITSLDLPTPTGIELLTSTAAFHGIYLVHFPESAAEALRPAEARNSDGSMTLVLRVSGDDMPGAKTMNEVAVMRWVRQNTRIPVPAVVRFDNSRDNVLGSEFTLLERVPGESIDRFYDKLPEVAKRSLVRQLTDILLELQKHEWHHIGGLRIAASGDIEPGPVLEEDFWLAPDIARLWPPGESGDTLNPKGPYDSHAAYIAAYLGCFTHAIQIHESLAWLRDMTPRLDALAARLPSIPSLAAERLVLAHKDLHFANLMGLPDGTLTGVLDWEFSGVVPALRWDPRRAFLWSAVYSDESSAEKERMRETWAEELRQRGVKPWWEGAGEDVADVWTVVKFVRALVEVCPRGERADKVAEWRAAVEEALGKLGC